MKYKLILATVLAVNFFAAKAQQAAKPEDTEFYEPVPKVVVPGKTFADPPSDAILLFDGKNLDQWVKAADRSLPAKWDVNNGIVTVKKEEGSIQTKQLFTNFQLHIEWRVPKNITGSGQARGNSGIFLAALGKGNVGYELQILDSYINKTYVNGMAGSIYKQFVPLSNPTRKPGEWQVYDIAWVAPTFNDNGSLKAPAKVTVFFNGVLVENNAELKGQSEYIGKPAYHQHGPAPIELQAHGDKSEAISFRNIWVREL